MIFVLAFRNLARNRRNTLIVFSLVLLISCFFFLGNSLLSMSQEGLRKTFSRNFTGDIVLMPKTDYPLSIFGATTPSIGDLLEIPPLSNLREAIRILEFLPEVEGYTFQLTGLASMDALGKRFPVSLFGVDPATYFSLFPGLSIEEGRVLLPGERGVLLSRERIHQMEKDTGKILRIGDRLLLSSTGRSGFRILEVPLRGIYRYRSSGPLMEEIILTDPFTVRELYSLTASAGQAVKTKGDQVDLLSGDLDSLFDEVRPVESSGEGVSLEALRDRVSQDESVQVEEANEGSWNFILIRLKPGVSHRLVLRELRSSLAGLSVEAVRWREAAGTSALIVLLLQVLFNAGFLMMAVAGILAVINVFLIAVFRRTREIGTLVALGASRAYVRSLILAENLVLSLGAGIAGVLFGVAVSGYIDRLALPVGNRLLATLLGQTVLSIPFSWPVAAASVACAGILGLVSSLYPVRVALRIEPATAVAKG